MRIRSAVLTMSIAAGVTLAAVPAIASSAPDVHVRSSSAVPTPGPGWMLATWTPHPRSAQPARFLELVSPSGAHYQLFRINGLSTQVAAWSGDGTRIALVSSGSGNTSVISIRSLATGAVEHAFTVHSAYVNVAFTRPDGNALLVGSGQLSGGGSLVRYSLSGAIQKRFTTSVPGLGPWTGSWLESADGTALALGMNQGVALVSNNGQLINRIHTSIGNLCQPETWWTGSNLLASCDDKRNPELVQLVEFATQGGTARQFVRIPHDSIGYSDAFSVIGTTFLQGNVTCGTPYLAKLVGTTPVAVHPHLRGSGAAVVSATRTSLALESADGCTGQNFVTWYTPATGSLVQVLGAPLQAGDVSPLGFPSPLTTGWPASQS